MAHELKKRKKLFEQKSSIYIRRWVRLPIHLPILSSSQTQGKTTQSVNFTTVLRIPLKVHISLREKLLSQPEKGILVSWCHNLMGEFLRLLWWNVNAYRKDRKCFKIVQTMVSQWKKILMLQNVLLRITRFSHSLLTTYLRLLHSGIYGWTFQALWMSKTSCSYQKHCYWQKLPDCLHVMILEANLDLLVLKRFI